MDKSEIFFEMQLPYDKLCSHLISKYGGAESDYGRKTTRTHDGLYCHHIDEDKGSNLGNAYQASTQPAEWQKKDRLVYCNILEHLILHIKIAVLRQKTLKKPSQVDLFISSSYGLLLICKEINDMYINAGTSVKWRQRCYEEVKTNYRDYIEILKSLLYYVFECYEGKKDELPFLRAGSVIHFSNYDCEITKVSRTFDKISLKMPSGEEETFNANIASLDFTFIDYLRFDTYKLACGFKMKCTPCQGQF